MIIFGRMRKFSTILFPAAALFLACSQEDKPNTPSVLLDGRVSIHNQTSIPIKLLDFTQERGQTELTRVLDVRVYPMHQYRLINYLDGGSAEVFPGGDRVRIRFAAEAADPENPGNPLFENTVSLIINGNNTISVKNGGQYSVGPG